MLTIADIKRMGSWTQPYREAVRKGCWLLPPIKLRCISDDLCPKVTNGEIVTVVSIDEDGPHPNTVHFEEKEGWWPPEHFELVIKTPIS